MAERNSLEEEESLRELKQQLQLQFEQSGMTSVIRKLVEDVCMSKDDLLSTNPDEVLQAIYSRGLMKNVMQQFVSMDVREIQPQNNLTFELAHGNNLRSDGSEDCILKLDSNPDFGLKQDISIHNINENTGIQSKARRFYLKVDILGGKAFLDHLSHEEGSLNYNHSTPKLVLHAFYKSQKFTTKPADCCCDPHFRDVFMIDIGYFQNGSVAQLLAIKEPLRIVIVSEDVNLHTTGGGTVLSYTLHDWRSVLLTDNGIESFNLELMGTGPEHNITVGLLSMTIKLLPSADEKVSENTFLSEINTEKINEEDQNRSFLSYTKHWWKDFLDIRPSHILRHVKLFAYDVKMISRSVTSLVEQLSCDNVLMTPFQAAWFTALFPVTQKQDNFVSSHNTLGNFTAGNTDHWQSLDITVSSKQGGVEDHAILLCSLFLGFGLNAFVALGSKKGKSTWAWTVTFDNSFKPTFWESTTGKRHKHQAQPDTTELPDERLLRIRENDVHKFQTIGCLFNNGCFFANIQPMDSVNLIDWNVLDPSKWKRIPNKLLEKLPKISNSPSIRAPTLDCLLVNKNIEAEMKMLFTEARSKENLTTRWDDTMSKLMGQQLATYELEASTGTTNLENFFEVVVMKYIPSGYDFKGFPFQTQWINARKIFYSCMRDSRCQEVVYCRGDDVHLSLRVMTFSYPENVTSVRLMISCKFLSTD